MHYRLNKKCSTCSVFFNCGITENDGGCWCNHFPAIFPMNFDVDCLCPDCLKKETLIKISQYVENINPEEALNSKVKDLPKTKKQIEDIDFYKEKENYVFTAWYHLKRGSCCKNACRHCPYGFNK